MNWSRVGSALRRVLPPEAFGPSKPSGSRIMQVVEDGQTLRFQVCSDMEAGRVGSFAIKEPGTLAWLREEVMPGQRFCDIGANIGLYSIYGAVRVGAAGRVYSFEPHLPNCASLLASVAVNSFHDRFDVFSCALHDRAGFFDFDCPSLTAGSSFNQIATGLKPSEMPQIEGLRAREKKYSTSLDLLIEGKVIEPPHHIKIDVDGNELSILHGMRNLLLGNERPISVQVELDPGFAVQIRSFLAEVGYEQTGRHFTYAGQQSLDRGVPAEEIAHNAIFKPKASR